MINVIAFLVAIVHHETEELRQIKVNVADLEEFGGETHDPTSYKTAMAYVEGMVSADWYVPTAIGISDSITVESFH